MGKTAKCIEMLQILAGGKKYKNSELADRLNVNVRNITEYRKELQECGYAFESTPGKYGGIDLKKSTVLPSLAFTKEERDSLVFVSSYVANQGTIYCRDDYENAMNKILSNMDWDGKKAPQVKVTDRSPLTLSTKELKERYDFFTQCIEKRMVVHIVYMTTIQKGIEDDVEPYKLVMDDDYLLLVCYSRKEKKYQCIKLNNIQSYKTSDAGFSKDYFSNEDCIDNTNFNFLKEKVHHVELRLPPSCPYIGGKEFGSKQTEETLDDGSVILKFDTEDLEGSLSTILSFQGECEVLSPQILRDKLMHIGRKIRQSSYKLETKKANNVEEPKAIVEPPETKSMDEIYQEVLRYCANVDFISISVIQRAFSIGFPKAGLFFTRLLSDGYIDPGPEGNRLGAMVIKSKFENAETPKSVSPVPPNKAESGGETRADKLANLLYPYVLIYCKEISSISIGDLQIRFRLGFPEAAKIMNRLIKDGYVLSTRDNRDFKHVVNIEKIQDDLKTSKERNRDL